MTNERDGAARGYEQLVRTYQIRRYEMIGRHAWRAWWLEGKSGCSVLIFRFLKLELEISDTGMVI